LKLVGEIEGDRFSRLVDVPAASKAGVLIVDTTHASSGPVAEWALALALVGPRMTRGFDATKRWATRWLLRTVAYPTVHELIADQATVRNCFTYSSRFLTSQGRHAWCTVGTYPRSSDR
jgi:lactate dehydrogenase-like 2-hydroxyacid dehydrogenase